MNFWYRHMPLNNPVLVLAITLLIILLSPLLYRKFRIPGVIGLIISGIIIGPHGLKIISSTSSFDFFSKTGMLYIMFLAGLEIDMQEFSKNKNKSLIFGILTFCIPILIGYGLCVYFFHMAFWPSLLLASMFSTHTLISYPIVSQMGVTKNRAVQVAFGGTIITDSAVLILLGIITNAVKGDLNGSFFIKTLFSISSLFFIVTFLIPRFSRWFFKVLDNNAGSHYIYVLTIVFISGYFSELAGVEPIIGAFLAGLGLNRVIPHNGLLMNRILFVGNTLFIPFFLISAGMLVNPSLFINGYTALVFAAILSLAGLFTKYIAAALTAWFYKYTKFERRILFGLSVSHAAATLAIIKVGYDLKLLDMQVVNGTILLILISCLVSSFVTEKAARSIALNQNVNTDKPDQHHGRYLIPISNPENVQRLMELAHILKSKDSKEPVYPLSVIEDTPKANQILQTLRKSIDYYSEPLINSGYSIEPIKRIDVNVIEGIIGAAKSYDISDIFITYKNMQSTTKFIFGNVHDGVIQKSVQTVWLNRLLQPFTSYKAIYLCITPRALAEPSSGYISKSLWRLLLQFKGPVSVFADSETLLGLQQWFQRFSAASLTTGPLPEAFSEFEILQDTLFLFWNARERTVSYNYTFDTMVQGFVKQSDVRSFITLYPEIYIDHGQLDDLGVSEIANPNYQRILNIPDRITEIFKTDDVK